MSLAYHGNTKVLYTDFSIVSVDTIDANHQLPIDTAHCTASRAFPASSAFLSQIWPEKSRKILALASKLYNLHDHNPTINNTLAGVAQLVERVALITAKRSTSRSWVRAPPSAIPISKLLGAAVLFVFCTTCLSPFLWWQPCFFDHIFCKLSQIIPVVIGRTQGQACQSLRIARTGRQISYWRYCRILIYVCYRELADSSETWRFSINHGR